MVRELFCSDVKGIESVGAVGAVFEQVIFHRVASGFRGTRLQRANPCAQTRGPPTVILFVDGIVVAASCVVGQPDSLARQI